VAHPPSFVAEAKFHLRPGIKSDLQVAMYSYARYLDLKSQSICAEDTCGIDDLYIITNTKFTSAAVNYSKCVGIKLLSWDYPHGHALQQKIEDAGIYPITALTTITNTHKRSLLESGIILCKDVLHTPEALRSVGIRDKDLNIIMDEASKLCAPSE